MLAKLEDWQKKNVLERRRIHNMFWVFMIMLSICISVLFGFYMYLCFENDVGLFYIPEKDIKNRILELENKIENLEKSKGV